MLVFIDILSGWFIIISKEMIKRGFPMKKNKFLVFLISSLIAIAVKPFVYCQTVNPGEGTLIWDHQTGAVLVSSPSVAYGKVYFGSLDDRFVCVDVSNGQKVWDFSSGNAANTFLSSPCVLDGKVYVGSYKDKKMYCLDAKTGVKIWDYTSGGEIESSPRVVGGKVYFGSWDGNAVCLDAESGSLLWEFKTGGNIRSSLLVYQGRVYFGSSDKRFYCLDGSSGKKIWDFDAGGSVFSSAASDGYGVYFASKESFFSLNVTNGVKLWEFSAKDIITSSPAVFGNRVYFGSYDKNFYCLKTGDGSIVWKFATGDNIQSSPCLVDEKVYFGGFDKNFYCLDSQTGKKFWSYPVKNIIETSPCVVDGKVYFGSDDGKLYCLEAGSIELTAGNSLSGQDYKAIKDEEGQIALEEQTNDEEPQATSELLDLVDTNEMVVTEPETNTNAFVLEETGTFEEEKPVVTIKPFNQKIVFHYTVQVGAFVKKKNADRLYQSLKKKGYAVYKKNFTLHGRKYIRVRIGTFVSYEEAYALKKKLDRKQVRSVVVKY